MLKKFEVCKQGRILSIRRFISKMAIWCNKPFTELLRKDTKLEWNSKFQKAFEDVKRYLLNPSVLSPPVPGRPLLLYISCTDFSIGWMCFRPDGHWYNALYYLSQTLVGYEMKYSPLEKTSYSFSVCNSEATSLYYMLCWPMQSNSWLVWILSNTCLRSQHWP